MGLGFLGLQWGYRLGIPGPGHHAGTMLGAAIVQAGLRCTQQPLWALLWLADLGQCTLDRAWASPQPQLPGTLDGYPPHHRSDGLRLVRTHTHTHPHTHNSAADCRACSGGSGTSPSPWVPDLASHSGPSHWDLARSDLICGVYTPRAPSVAGPWPV